MTNPQSFHRWWLSPMRCLTCCKETVLPRAFRLFRIIFGLLHAPKSNERSTSSAISIDQVTRAALLPPASNRNIFKLGAYRLRYACLRRHIASPLHDMMMYSYNWNLVTSSQNVATSFHNNDTPRTYHSSHSCCRRCTTTLLQNVVRYPNMRARNSCLHSAEKS